MTIDDKRHIRNTGYTCLLNSLKMYGKWHSFSQNKMKTGNSLKMANSQKHVYPLAN